jgi:Uma2 family endonuclease
MAQPVETGLTVADLARFDDDERYKYELAGGELFVSPKGLPRHQYVASLLVRRLLDWTDEHEGAAFVEPDLYYTDRDFVIPDVVLLRADTLARISERHIDVAPDLVVEVSSPSTRRLDVVIKRVLYEHHGVPEYWFVDLDADRVEACPLAEDGYGPPEPPELAGAGDALRPAHLPGLAVDVDDVLRPLG